MTFSAVVRCFEAAGLRAFGGMLERLRYGGWPVVQSAVAASLAWYLAEVFLGHERPFVAAIAAVISVGAVAGQTLRRAAEWIFGVALGLAVADLIMLAIGTGVLQTGFIVGLAMAVALMIRGGVMLVTEAGVSALLVANLDPTTYGVSPDRFIEALVGGGTALAVSALFPSDPRARVERTADRTLVTLAAVQREIAAALDGGDLERAERALREARGIDARVAELRETLDGGYEIARYSPPRRRMLGQLSYYATAAEQLDLAVRNTRVLARAAVSMVQERGAAPPAVCSAIEDLARAVEALDAYLDRPEHPLDTRAFALQAASKATAVLRERTDLETSVLVGQIRSTALDLLQASGMSSQEALRTMRETCSVAPSDERC
ncbi:hypothetical protein Rxycam_01990 [Rubrobacter xylanophilus DSM 9941]|uniref:FUSC family protein n=1 Tax=Rubrobacter xylanophilus TaxID=49319 RepID=UPI001C63C824|nr:FUSC family protein [Rubrobacter xylanophilus]QYJ16159.1 hypothetical protein Rxycam_01990 [Rubrobacter xylanophilus DSM 9941]